MELKYKIYDKTSDKMFLSSEIMIEVNSRSEVVAIDDKYYIDSENEIEAVILQYTGVKDINKKESYLGDILKEPVKSKNERKRKKVIWCSKKRIQ